MISVDKLNFGLKLFAALGCGLMAGVFFAFSTFVMKGLSRLPANEGIAAMQFINASVSNSLFGAAFILTPVICVLTIIFALWRWDKPASIYILIGGMIYLVGSLLVTIVFNIPQNELLALTVPNDSNSANLWNSFLDSWMFWNHVRAAASLAATASFTIALVY